MTQIMLKVLLSFNQPTNLCKRFVFCVGCIVYKQQMPTFYCFRDWYQQNKRVCLLEV